MTVQEWIRGAAEALRLAGVESPRLEAEALAAHALGCSRAFVHAHSDEEAPVLALAALLERRLSGEPFAYVVGRREFYGRSFCVDRNVLIPRAETECLVEAVAPKPGMRCADIGTGSGVLAITQALEVPGVEWMAGDVSRQALRVAQLNARDLGACVSFVCGDALSFVRPNSLDLVVSNPPYIAAGDPRLDPAVRDWEPDIALYAPSGIGFIERLIEGARRALKPGGVLAFEFGEGQENEVCAFLPYCDIVNDLSGKPRCARVVLN